MYVITSCVGSGNYVQLWRARQNSADHENLVKSVALTWSWLEGMDKPNSVSTIQPSILRILKSKLNCLIFAQWRYLKIGHWTPPLSCSIINR